MRFLGTLLACIWLFNPVLVLGDVLATPYELGLFYYLYKIEKTIGLDGPAFACGGEGICRFDEFVRFVMEASFQRFYRPTVLEQTLTPDAASMTELEGFIQDYQRGTRPHPSGDLRAPKFKLEALTNVATANDVRGGNSAMIRGFLKGLAVAAKSGEVPLTDLDSAIFYARSVLSKRRIAVQPALAQYLREAGAPPIGPYLSFTSDGSDQWIDFQETFAKIRAAITAGTINFAQGQTLVDQTRAWSRNIPFSPANDDVARLHSSIMQIYTKFVTETTNWSEISHGAGVDRVLPGSVPDQVCRT